MVEERKYLTFQELCEQQARAGGPQAAEARKYLVPGKNALQVAIDRERVKLQRAIATGDDSLVARYRGTIERAEEKGMIDGSFDVTYEGAERIYKNVRKMVEKAGEKSDTNYAELFDSFDPITDQDLISTGIFCLIPEVRRYVLENSDILYRIALTARSRDGAGYTLPTRHKSSNGSRSIISSNVGKILTSLPEPQTDTEAENQRKLKILLDKKVERETFHFFRDDPRKTMGILEQRVRETKNKNLQGAYERLRTVYNSYLHQETPEANPLFRDPRTGAVGVLPSLHQKSALYHLARERKLGIFDGCGTGKTAIATLAQPLIEKELGRKPRTIILCPNSAKKAWKKGLAGNEDQRYLVTKQNVLVVNGDKKDENFMKEVTKADWVVLNHEQLITNVGESDDIFIDKLKEMSFDFVIIDEAHHMKSQKKTTKTGKPTLSAAAQEIAHNSPYVALLTATPIADRLNDYGVLANILQPDKFPNPESLREKIRQSPRELYTFFHEKTVRRTSEDINDELDWEEKEERVEISGLQKQVYAHLEEKRPTEWVSQGRKALLDPRLVDPEVLRRAGVLGKIGLGSSAKYQRLEELLTADDGPVARGEKFIIFSSMFREGVTQEGHAYLQTRYNEMDNARGYESLQLDITLDKILQKAITKKFGKKLKVGVIDGTISEVEARERTVEQLSHEDGLAGIVCTTDTGGESLDFTAASYVVFLDEDYSPTTAEQALSRVVRKGQGKKVTIVHLRAPKTLDDEVRDYVQAKRIITKIAMDGHTLTEKELDLLDDTDGKKLKDMVKRRVGGTSIDTYAAEITALDDFETKRRNPGVRKSRTLIAPSDYETTDAQKINQLIGQDPVGCWFDPEFVELYMKTLPNLSVPVTQRAKIIDLVKRAREVQILFPKKVLADGSGPSLLWEAYRGVAPLIAKAGYSIPQITDRDVSPLMLDAGKNKRKILGNMTGENSTVNPKSFDMVDNESIKLLRSDADVKRTLLESHRVLKDFGLLELVVQNTRFAPSFYSGIEGLGFEILSDKNTGFAVSRDFLKRLKVTHGEHFAESYASKLANTYMLLARKVDKPVEVEAEKFVFEKIEPDEPKENEQARDPTESRSIMTPGRKRGRRNSSKTKSERIEGGIEFDVDRSGVVRGVRKKGGK